MQTTEQLIRARLWSAPGRTLSQTRLHEALRYRDDGRKVLRRMLRDGDITKFVHREPGAPGRRPVVYRLLSGG